MNEKNRQLHYRSVLIILVLTISFFSRCSSDEDEPITSMGFTGEHYLEVANSIELKSLVSGDFTIEVWATGDSSQADVSRSLFMLGNNDGGNEIAIYQGAVDSSLVTVYIDGVLFYMASVSALDWTRQKKHHLCLTRASDFFSFYVDGSRVKSVSLSNTDLDIGSSNLLIGADYDPPGVNSNPGNYWVGTIDEVRIWAKSIQSEEVEFHKDNPDKLTKHYTADGLDPLIGLWRFNKERTGFIPDESGHDHDAVIRGAAESVFWSKD